MTRESTSLLPLRNRKRHQTSYREIKVNEIAGIAS
jgi:hypothetical protein